MAKYLLIESRDPYQYAETGAFYQVAADLAAAGNEVTFFLVQNGVFPARQGASNSPVAQLHSKAPCVNVVADGFSLQERAIVGDRLAEGVKVAPIDDLVDLLAEPDVKAIWH